MDSLDLLAREEEFRKLNKQLEQKSSQLMKEIENTMKKQDFFTEFSDKLKNTQNNRKIYVDTSQNVTIKNNLTATPNSKKTSPKHTKNSTKIINETQELTSNKQSVIAQSKDRIAHRENNSIKIAQHDDKTDDKDDVTRNVIVCNCYKNDGVNEELHFLHAFVTVNVHDKVFPQSFLKESPTVESVCKFLSTKMKLLQDQIDGLQLTIDKKTKQCDVHLTHYAELDGEKLKLLNQINHYRSEVTEYKNKNTVLFNKLNEKDCQYKEKRSEADKLSAEMKKIRSKHLTAEARCINLEDEVNRLKQQIDTLKLAEKEFRESTRTHSTNQNSAISRLEARIQQHIGTIKKLHELISNLKRQNTILSTEVLLEGLDKDYSKLLLGED